MIEIESFFVSRSSCKATRSAPQPHSFSEVLDDRPSSYRLTSKGLELYADRAVEYVS